MAPTSTLAPNYPPVKLPHPFLTSYRVHANAQTTPARLVVTLDAQQPGDGRPLPEPLHLDSLSWLDLTFPPEDERPPGHDNSPWARSRRSPSTTFLWTGDGAPSLGPVWNVIHAIFLAHPTYEYFRLTLSGEGKDVLTDTLLATGLAIDHPKPRWDARGPPAGTRTPIVTGDGELLVLRSSFWQGAASPMGPRPIWVVGDGTDSHLQKSLASYPIMPENFQITNKFPDGEPVFTRHPTRRPKPRPGSIVYSRYIPELDAHFSLEAVDWQNAEHLQLFNTWQNDPRVAAGWNETGTLDQHREYLRKLHVDPHVLCLFGRFDQSRFAYYELYWAKVRPGGLSIPEPDPNAPFLSRRTTAALTSTPATTTVAATRSSATRRFAARSASTRGIRAASTTASSTTRAPPMWWGSRAPRARPSCHMRTLRAWWSGVTSIWVTSGRCTRFVVGRNGSSLARCFGMGGRSRWSARIAPLGTRSCRLPCLGWKRKYPDDAFSVDNALFLPEFCHSAWSLALDLSVGQTASTLELMARRVAAASRSGTQLVAKYETLSQTCMSGQ